MYAKCGSIDDAWKVFNKMPTRNVVVRSAMILGCVKCGQEQKGLELFQQMQREGVEPNAVTYMGLLNACASLMSLEEGRRLHKQVIERGYEADVNVVNSIVDMYAKCGSMKDAWKMFSKMATHTVVSWNARILGYVKCGEGEKALELSRKMQGEGVDPDSVTFVGLLNAYASIGALEEGRRVHQHIIERGYESDNLVGNSLIDMCAKCGSIEDARNVFDKMPTRDVVGWTAMIQGYVKCGEGQQALELSRKMQVEGVDPDPVTFVGMLNACASVGVLEDGRRVHQQIIGGGHESDVFVCNSLTDMYAKCGSIEDALRVFNNMPTRDGVSWSAILGGYAMNGHAKEALAQFERICQGDKVDGVTFVSLQSACNHGGLVDEGLCYFESMSAVYGISPAVEHYACIVDLLGLAGRLDEAVGLIKTMPSEPNAYVWMSLLGALRAHGNMEMAECVSKLVLELDPKNVSSYVLLSNIYAAAGKWDSSAKVKRERLERPMKKEPDLTQIEVNAWVHSFAVEDRKHPQNC